MWKKIVAYMGLCALLFLMACSSGVEEAPENQQAGAGAGSTFNSTPAPGQQGAPPPPSDAPPPVKGRR